MNQKNCMVAQSGGPTVAINASLAGVIDGVSASSMYDTVYGSLNGITGILNDDLLNLTELMDGHPEYLSRLAQTPAMYLGTENASAVPSALSASRRPSTMISARPITPRALALPQNTLPPRS